MELPGVETRRFRPSGGAPLWEGLQVAYQSLRRGCDACGIMARDLGCAGALAIAEQLPVDRLVLIEPSLSVGRRGARRAGDGNDPFPAPMWREMRRLAAFARRNLPLCVSDVLIVEGGNRPVGRWDPIDRLPGHARVVRLRLRGKTGDDLYTIREIAVKQAISDFLRAGELPKPLAENPEMCIIDG